MEFIHYILEHETDKLLATVFLFVIMFIITKIYDREES